MKGRAKKLVTVPGSRIDALRVDTVRAKVRGNHRRAIELGERFLAKRPNDLQMLDFLAGIHLDRKDWAAFLLVGMKSYLKEPKAEHLLTLLNAYLQLGRYDAGLAFYERERTRKPESMLDESPTGAWKIHSYIRRIKRARRKEEKARARQAKAAKREARKLAKAAARAPEQTDSEAPAPRPHALKKPLWPAGPPPVIARRVRLDERTIDAELLSPGENGAGIPVQFVDAPRRKCRGLAERFADEFQTVNVRCELTAVSETIAEYLEIEWSVAVEKPEHGEAGMDVWISRRTSALVEFPHGSLAAVRAPCESECTALPRLDSAEVRSLIRGAAANAASPLDGCVGGFVRRAQAALNHDFADRDAELRSEWERFIDRLDSRVSVGQTEVDGRLRQLVSQRQHAAAELANKHEVTVSLRPVGLRRLLIPVTACSVRITRRANSRLLAMTWNPIIRRFEPAACEQCGANTYLLAANQAAELRCVDCLAGRSSHDQGGDASR